MYRPRGQPPEGHSITIHIAPIHRGGIENIMPKGFPTNKSVEELTASLTSTPQAKSESKAEKARKSAVSNIESIFANFTKSLVPALVASEDEANIKASLVSLNSAKARAVRAAQNAGDWVYDSSVERPAVVESADEDPETDVPEALTV